MRPPVCVCVMCMHTAGVDTHTARRSAFHEWNNRYTTIQRLSSATTGDDVVRRRQEEVRYATNVEVSGPANSRKMRWPSGSPASLFLSFSPRPIVHRAPPPVEIESRARKNRASPSSLMTDSPARVSC